MRLIFSSFMIILALLRSSPAFSAVEPEALAISFEPGQGSIDFIAIGKPGFLKIHGKGSSPNGTLIVEGNQVSGTLASHLDTFDTGIKLRNTHMKEKYLETSKYPEATLTIDKFALPSDAAADALSIREQTFEGTFSLHGVKKQVRGIVDVHASPDNANATTPTYAIGKFAGAVKIDARFEIRLADYNIAVPTYAGLTVADTVQVSLSGKFPVRLKHDIAK